MIDQELIKVDEELIKKTQAKQCFLVKNQTLRDACSRSRLSESICTKIENALQDRGVALGSPLTPTQEGSVLLYDNREGSNIRKLLELAASVQSGKAPVMWGGCPAAVQLPLAAAAAFKG